jgi:CMP-N-acetylneuraminic acid synthetase
LNIVGIIPARGGSKTIPDKNIYKINGVPMIEYTVNAVKSSMLDEWFVFTDKYGNYQTLNIKRPPTLSRDDTPMCATIKEAVKLYESAFSLNGYIDAVMILQPTSPLRTKDDINYALFQWLNEQSKRPNKQCLVSVTETYNQRKLYKRTLDGYKSFEMGEYDKSLDNMLIRNSAIFITSRALIDSGCILDDNPSFFLMPKLRSVDIDTMEDIFLCEALLKAGVLNGP